MYTGGVDIYSSLVWFGLVRKKVWRGEMKWMEDGDPCSIPFLFIHFLRSIHVVFSCVCFVFGFTALLLIRASDVRDTTTVYKGVKMLHVCSSADCAFFGCLVLCLHAGRTELPRSFAHPPSTRDGAVLRRRRCSRDPAWSCGVYSGTESDACNTGCIPATVMASLGTVVVVF